MKTRFVRAAGKNFEEKRRLSTDLQVRISHLKPNFDVRSERVDLMVSRLRTSFKHDFEKKSVSLTALYARLQSLDIERVLERGFCLVQDEKGHVYTGVDQLAVGSDVEMVFSQGRALANVKQISQKK